MFLFALFPFLNTWFGRLPQPLTTPIVVALIVLDVALFFAAAFAITLIPNQQLRVIAFAVIAAAYFAAYNAEHGKRLKAFLWGVLIIFALIVFSTGLAQLGFISSDD
jgi:di/tricarboxylate transporter